jgi:VanZ family protein
MPEPTVPRIVALLALVGVLVLSFLPSDSVDPMRLNIGYSGDIGHVLAYALLAGALMLSVPSQTLTLWRGICIVFTISLLGIAIELLQPLVGRTTSVVDFTENEVGIAGGVVIFYGYLLAQRYTTKGSDSRPHSG